MRQLTKYAKNNLAVQAYLKLLAEPSTPSALYADAFLGLGIELSKIISAENDLSSKRIILACSSEDADILAKGILEGIESRHISLAVFWNLRFNASGKKELAAAPIIKSYIEDLTDSDILIICKSIINTSCVVRTNLTYLIENTRPAKIIIASPVLYKDAETSLKQEFADKISAKFNFIYFARDSKVNKKGEVIPGIGGSIYERLGFTDASDKNHYIPNIVSARRKLQPL